MATATFLDQIFEGVAELAAEHPELFVFGGTTVVANVQETRAKAGGPCDEFAFSGTPFCDNCAHTH